MEIVSFSHIYIFFRIRILPESARWLYTTQQNEKADKIVRKMAKWNKKQLPERLDITVQV